MTKKTRTTLFGRRLQAARLRLGIPQDKLGVAVGLDESCSSTRMSRYETGIHEPPFTLVEKIAEVLCVPVPYFFCADERLATILLRYPHLSETQKNQLLTWISAQGTNEIGSP